MAWQRLEDKILPLQWDLLGGRIAGSFKGGQVVACNCLAVTRALGLALLLCSLSLALGGCGRKGPLDPPPSAAMPPPPPGAPGAGPAQFVDPTTPVGGAQPVPISTAVAAPPPPKKTFLLDPLLQ
ncbi:MAG: lipoprotein [Xanthobacteraceae bacterium]